jgi:IS30 family transposase
MRLYYRLNHREREEISRMLMAGFGTNRIARYLQRSSGTISREIRRNSKDGSSSYRGHLAHWQAVIRSRENKKKLKLKTNLPLQELVHGLLCKYWSPEQIAQYLKKQYSDNPSMNVSHETIYRYLYVLPRGELKKELIACLRQKRKTRRHRYRNLEKQGSLPFITSIEERPQEAEDRRIPGHWEGDLLIGRNRRSALGTLVERTTRFTLIVPLKKRDGTSVRRAFAREMKLLPEQLRRSMTYDRGREMSQHQLFTKQTKVKVYFAHPYSPWERGTNENTNGLLRQFFPKGTDLSKHSYGRIKEVQNLLNERPRKVLNWDSPLEVFSKLLH